MPLTRIASLAVPLARVLAHMASPAVALRPAKDEDITKCRPVHITGSKGKGSTASMVESILRHHGIRTGLFTSPHLQEARERIRIDAKPIPRDMFARQLFECLEMLNDPTKPRIERTPA